MTHLPDIVSNAVAIAPRVRYNGPIADLLKGDIK